MAPISTHPSLLESLRNPADNDSWRTFDHRYGELILRYCLARGLQHTDADDVRQMVMIKLARAMPRFRYSPARGRFRSYLGRIVHNELIRLLGRPSRAWQRVDDDEDVTAGVDDDDARWDREWAYWHVRQAMRQVRGSFDARSLEVFDRLLAGETVAQTAAAYGMTAQAVHKVKQRVRDRLREIVADQVRDEEQVHDLEAPT